MYGTDCINASDLFRVLSGAECFGTQYSVQLMALEISDLKPSEMSAELIRLRNLLLLDGLM